MYNSAWPGQLPRCYRRARLSLTVASPLRSHLPAFPALAVTETITMLAQFSLHLDLSHWEPFTAPVVGLSSAALMLIVARMFLSGRKQVAPPAHANNGAPLEDPYKSPAVGERRTSVRRRGHAVNVLISNANADAEPFPGCVHNRSFGGLCLVVPRAVEVNGILSVRTADGRIVWQEVGLALEAPARTT